MVSQSADSRAATAAPAPLHVPLLTSPARPPSHSLPAFASLDSGTVRSIAASCSPPPTPHVWLMHVCSVMVVAAPPTFNSLSCVDSMPTAQHRTSQLH